MREMAFEVRLDTPFEQSLEAVIAALKEEGFGVLTRVDIHNAFKEWFKIDFWTFLRKRREIGERIISFDQRIGDLIDFRHSVIHEFRTDPDLDREELKEVLDLTKSLIEVFLDHLEQNHNLMIRVDV